MQSQYLLKEALETARFTLLPSWPRPRAIELSPKHWASTKQRPEVAAQLAELDFLARAKPLEPRQVST